MCSIPGEARKDLNSELAKPEPLSDTSCSGQPCMAKIERSARIVASLEVEGTMWSSNHLVYESINIKYYLLRKGQA